MDGWDGEGLVGWVEEMDGGMRRDGAVDGMSREVLICGSGLEGLDGWIGFDG